MISSYLSFYNTYNLSQAVCDEEDELKIICDVVIASKTRYYIIDIIVLIIERMQW